MKTKLTIGLLFIILLISSFAFADLIQSGQPSVTVVRPEVCRFSETITNIGSKDIFAGPKVGWMKVPVENEVQIVRCYPAVP